MRRLDESLTRLAERGQRAGAEALIERLDRRLELGEDPVVVALEPRRTGMQTQDKTKTVRTRRGPWIAAAAFAAVLAVVAGAVMISQTGESESLVAGQPPGPLEEFVLALQAGDTETVDAVVDEPEMGFPHWLIGLGTSDVEFTDCAMTDADHVSCSVSMGSDWFYSRIVGYPLETTFSAIVDDGRLRRPEFPTPQGLAPAEAEFEDWVLETYPERWDEMFTEMSFVENILFNHKSGAARAELLEEFLASR